MKKCILLILSIFYMVQIIYCSIESIKISIAKSSGNGISYKVTWLSMNELEAPMVLYNNYKFNQSDSQDSFLVEAAEVISYDTKGFTGFTNTVTMSGLIESTTYYYCTGDKSTGEWSEIYNFTTGSILEPTVDGNQIVPFSATFFGDMGFIESDNLNSDFYTVDNLLSRSNSYDFIVHLGDIAYADEITKHGVNGGNQTVWNQFLNSVNPLTTNKPYFTCPGNHDLFEGTTQVYRNTWQMPTDSHFSNWYSFDYNGVHFISISSEDDYFIDSDQYQWFVNDLSTYRNNNPTGWLVVYGHRSFYCSAEFKWCDDSNISRKFYKLSLEPLLYKYGVNLFIGAHAHVYEYSKPVYQGETMKDAPVHIVVGTGGNKGGDILKFQSLPSYSSGFRTSLNGFGLLNVLNSTHINWQFVANKNNTIVDEFYIINTLLN